MLNRFGKTLLGLTILFHFEGYLYISEPPSSDVYFLWIVVVASFIALILSFARSGNLINVIHRITHSIMHRKHTDIDSYEVAQFSYSASSLSFMYFICINLVLMLIYM